MPVAQKGIVSLMNQSASSTQVRGDRTGFEILRVTSAQFELPHTRMIQQGRDLSFQSA